jgi:hypothetical protein
MNDAIRVLGIHPVSANEPVHLVEIEWSSSRDLDFGEITQEVEGEDEDYWQVPWDECLLASTPNGGRAAFFFHYLDCSQPLRTPFGRITLPPATPIPDHLADMRYEEP